jgi:hypothetical protein
MSQLSSARLGLVGSGQVRSGRVGSTHVDIRSVLKEQLAELDVPSVSRTGNQGSVSTFVGIRCASPEPKQPSYL